MIGRKGPQTTLYYAVVNIPGMDIFRGDILTPYVSPDSTSDKYEINIYRQSNRILSSPITNRKTFNLDNILRNSSEKVASVYFTTQAPSTSIIVPVVPGIIPGQKIISGDEYFKDPSRLSEQDKKYCRCVLHVAGKQIPECLRDRAWYQTIGGKTCANPYPICAKSTRHSSRECGENYNFEAIPDNELVGYASYHKIHVPQPYNREQMIRNIYAWKETEGKI
jgi:hypothetical protein